jgi:hypothetical protein
VFNRAEFIDLRREFPCLQAGDESREVYPQLDSDSAATPCLVDLHAFFSRRQNFGELPWFNTLTCHDFASIVTTDENCRPVSYPLTFDRSARKSIVERREELCRNRLNYCRELWTCSSFRRFPLSQFMAGVLRSVSSSCQTRSCAPGRVPFIRRFIALNIRVDPIGMEDHGE